MDHKKNIFDKNFKIKILSGLQYFLIAVQDPQS